MIRFMLLWGALGISWAAGGLTDAKVMRVHRSLLLVDTHNDVTSRILDGFDIGPRAASGHTDVARLRQGGVGAVFFAVYVGASYETGHHSAHRALEMIDTVRQDIVSGHRGDFVLALTAADIEAARRRHTIAALMGVEGGHAIEDSLRVLRDFYRLGARYMTLTHVNTNNWADSSGDEQDPQVKRHGGLTDFGRQVVREMNRLGMMVDVSHVSDKTFWDALEASNAPIIASHSSCRAIAPIARNMTDQMIEAMAKKGGVIQINFGCQFVAAQKAGAPPHAGIADVVDNIDHVVKIAGIGAVGIGTDYDGVDCVPEGLEDVSKFPNLTRALLEKGYNPRDIRKIYGGNILRVMRTVERAAAR